MPRVTQDPDINALRAIAHPVRLRVLQLLKERHELTVGELLTRSFVVQGYSQSALSQHLSVLRREGLVATRKDSQRVYYRLQTDRIAQLYALLARLHE